MWKDKCHKCGTPIFNGIPANEMKDYKPEIFIAKMKAEGYTLGYNKKTIGYMGHIEQVPCKPICTICSDKASQLEDKKEKNKAISQIKKTLKKVYVCPCCEYSIRVHGYNNIIFKSSSESEMISHIREKHDTREIEKITR